MILEAIVSYNCAVTVWVFWLEVVIGRIFEFCADLRFFIVGFVVVVGGGSNGSSSSGGRRCRPCVQPGMIGEWQNFGSKDSDLNFETRILKGARQVERDKTKHSGTD